MKPIVLIRILAVLLLTGPHSRGESMPRYFNTSWAELARKMPEIAEAGYQSLWLPPPNKGVGGLSVGYDLWDRSDLGSKDQRGTTRTRYGTEAGLLEMVRVAHRFGIRVYFDNIMNHNAFDVPGFNAGMPIDVYPGFVPEDFHLRRTEDGFHEGDTIPKIRFIRHPDNPGYYCYDANGNRVGFGTENGLTAEYIQAKLSKLARNQDNLLWSRQRKGEQD